MRGETPTILPAASDPIRIVPIHVPKELSQPAEGVAAPPPPHLTYRGGPLRGSVEIFTVFWGTPWTTAPLSSMAHPVPLAES